MKLIVQPYNGGADAYNAEEEETNFRTYTLDHEFYTPARAVITLADKDGSMMRKYSVSNGAVGGAVAVDDGGPVTDETTEANEDTPDDMTLLPAIPAVDDAYYIGFFKPFPAVLFHISTAGVAPTGWTITWEYSRGFGVWDALSDVVDGTASFFNAGHRTVDWTIPDNWASETVGGIADLYWVRGRVTAYTDVTTPPKGQQAWIGGTYIGPGKITIEDPDGTDIFFGRIKNVIGNFESRTVTLECADWLDQLDEELITYDMREDLDSDGDMGEQGLRQSYLHADPNNATIVDVAYNDGGGPDKYYLYDDNRSWNVDEFNGMSLFLTVGMAGTKTWRFFPYDSDDSGGITYTDDVEVLWVDDDGTEVAFDNADFTLDYHFRIYLGNDIPSNFYIHSSITGARVFARWQVTDAGVGNHSHIMIDDKTDGWLEFAVLDEDDHFTRTSWDVTPTDLSKIIDANGLATVRFDMDRVGGNTTISLTLLYIEADVETIPYSTAITINDTLDLNGDGGKVNCLEVDTDMTAAATRMWEGVPYCIAKPRFKHIDTAEGGTLISGGDTIVPLTAAATIEHTSGISTRQHKNRTRLQIVQAEAHDDKSVFWMALGSTTITYKQTWGANTETMTDATPDNWQSQRDYSSLVNSVDMYGAQIGDYEIFQQSQDTDSITTYKATRSKVIKNIGLVTDADALAIGTVIAARDANISQMVGCTLSGFDTTYRLGTIVEITSSYLWDTAAKDYIVTRWAYDSVQHKTFLTMHPKVSIGLQEVKTLMTEGDNIKKTTELSELDKVVNDPITHEVA